LGGCWKRGRFSPGAVRFINARIEHTQPEGAKSFSKDSKVALVTGAAMGIGVAIAEQLAQDGMTVLVSDLNREEVAKTAARRFSRARLRSSG
jgi:3-oxoacyl-ACP reductase-like protein